MLIFKCDLAPFMWSFFLQAEQTRIKRLMLWYYDDAQVQFVNLLNLESK